MNQNKLISIGAGCLAVGLVIGFFGGTYYQSKQASVSQSGSGMRGQFGGAGGGAGAGARGSRGGFGGTTGDVVSKDATGITVKSRDGGSKVILITPSTTVGHMTTGTIEDITTGVTVIVNGTSNSDGSVTANSIQIRPAMTPPPAGGQNPADAPKP